MVGFYQTNGFLFSSEQKVSFLALFKNPILEVTSAEGVTLKKIILGLCPTNYFGSHYTCGEVREKI